MHVRQIEEAFARGYDPALELAKQHTGHKIGSGDSYGHGIAEDIPASVQRKEQSSIDSIMWGNEPGHYYMLLGPKVRVHTFVLHHDAYLKFDNQ